MLPSDNPNSSANGKGCSASKAEEVGKRTRLGLGGNAGRCVCRHYGDTFLVICSLKQTPHQRGSGPFYHSICFIIFLLSFRQSSRYGRPPRIFFINRLKGRDTCLTRASFKPFGILESNNMFFSCQTNSFRSHMFSVTRPLYSLVNHAISSE